MKTKNNYLIVFAIPGGCWTDQLRKTKQAPTRRVSAQQRDGKLRRAGREGRILSLLLRRPLRSGLCRRDSLDATYLHDPSLHPLPGTGYGFDEESKKMLGEFTWGDVHHPALSQTNSKYDGRWLFVNDNANNRIARIDLRDFKTHQILGPIPNSIGNHGSSFITENSEYILCASRFSVPLPKGRVADPNDFEKEFNGMVSGIKVDPQTGEMKVGWQILTPPFDWDLGSTGKGPSSGCAFWTSYNTEMAHDTLEVNSSQKDRDLAAVVNWRAAEKAVAEGKAEMMDGVPIIDPAKVPGVLYFVPIGKSPHGMDVDPTGKWIVAGGKLQPATTVLNFEKVQAAINNKTFEGEVRGIPILKYEAWSRAKCRSVSVHCTLSTTAKATPTRRCSSIRAL